MGKEYKTMRGVPIDITKLRSLHSNDISIGNMPVNAKGDEIDYKGNVIKKRGEDVKSRDSGVYNTKTMKNVSLKASVKEDADIEENVVEKKQTTAKVEHKHESKSTSKPSSSD